MSGAERLTPGESGEPEQPIELDAPAIERDRAVRAGEELVVPLHSEELAVSVRRVDTATVRVATVTHVRDHAINEPLTRERVEVEHVPIGRYVDAVPPVREEGDLTILSIVDEVVVVERKLMLREEVHIRRVRTTEQHTDTVQLREQEAVVTRVPASQPVADAALPEQTNTMETK